MALIAALFVVNSARAADPYTPLWLYNGTWQITKKEGSPDKLINHCVLVGQFFACEQTVNGTPGPLLIFVPLANKPGHYYTQSVYPEGRAGGRGSLEIEGDKWVYTSTWDQGGSTIYYRTTNTLTGRNKIHFEQAESSDNKNFTVKNSGDEVRIAGTGLKPAR
jgi:hypothetical protein